MAFSLRFRKNIHQDRKASNLRGLLIHNKYLVAFNFQREIVRRFVYLCKDKVRFKIYQFNHPALVEPNIIWNEQNIKLLWAWESSLYMFSNQNSVHPSSLRSKTNLIQLGLKLNARSFTYQSSQWIQRLRKRKKATLANLMHFYQLHKIMYQELPCPDNKIG